MGKSRKCRTRVLNLSSSSDSSSSEVSSNNNESNKWSAQLRRYIGIYTEFSFRINKRRIRNKDKARNSPSP